LASAPKKSKAVVQPILAGRARKAWHFILKASHFVLYVGSQRERMGWNLTVNYFPRKKEMGNDFPSAIF
jgi:hypothetical protein